MLALYISFIIIICDENGCKTNSVLYFNGRVKAKDGDVDTAALGHQGGAVAEWVRVLAWTGDRTVSAAFESHCGKPRFGTLAIPFTPLCQCLSKETLKAVGPFYLVSTPGEVKDPTSPHWNV